MIKFKRKKFRLDSGVNRLSNLSPHFTYLEIIESDYALRHNIDNEPSLRQVENLSHLCTKVLEKIRKHYDAPVIITSGFRGPKVNKGVGGYKHSQHKAEGDESAADFIVPKYKINKVWEWVVEESGIDFDCCILEFNTWIHISYKWKGSNRNKILIAKKRNGKTIYYKANDQNDVKTVK